MIDEIHDFIANIDTIPKEDVRDFYVEMREMLLVRMVNAYDNLLGDARDDELDEVLADAKALEALAYAFACRYKEVIANGAIWPLHLRLDAQPTWATGPTEFITQAQIDQEVWECLAERYPTLCAPRPRPI